MKAIEESLEILQDGLDTLLEDEADPALISSMNRALNQLLKATYSMDKIGRGWREEVESKIGSLLRRIEELEKGAAPRGANSEGRN